MRPRVRYSHWLDLLLFFATCLAGTCAWVVLSDVFGWAPQEPIPVADRGTSRDWYGVLALFLGVFPALLVLRLVVYPLLGWNDWLFTKRSPATPGDEDARAKS